MGRKQSSVMQQSGSSIMGTYKAPYKSEGMLKGIVISAICVLAIFVLLIGIKFLRDHFSHDASDTLLLLATAIVLIVAEAVVIVLGVVITKSVCGGYKCTYIADTERFITNEGGNHRELYYWEIQDVLFEQMTSLGKVRGYEVTVVTLHKSEVYRVVSAGFISKESTPFHLLTERVDQYRAKKARETYMQEIRAINSAPVPTNSDEQNDPSSRLGMDAEMPTVGLPKN